MWPVTFLVPGSGRTLAYHERAAIDLGIEVYALTRFMQVTIASHRDAARFRAQGQSGVLLASLVSAVDAFVSSRLSSAAHRPTTLLTARRRTDAVFSLSVVLWRRHAGWFDSSGRQS